jgi:hypothetical protein
MFEVGTIEARNQEVREKELNMIFPCTLHCALCTVSQETFP